MKTAVLGYGTVGVGVYRMLASAAGLKTPATEDGRALLSLAADSLTLSAAPSGIPGDDQVALGVAVRTLNVHKLAALLNVSVNESLAAAVENARVASEVYDENWQFRSELVRAAFSEALSAAPELSD